MSVQELYKQTVKGLPAAERLRLAALILNDISPQSVVDYSEQYEPSAVCLIATGRR